MHIIFGVCCLDVGTLTFFLTNGFLIKPQKVKLSAGEGRFEDVIREGRFEDVIRDSVWYLFQYFGMAFGMGFRLLKLSRQRPLLSGKVAMVYKKQK